MKQLYLTIDYELFLGDCTGSVQECMINPTYKLAEILAKNGSKMTVFWDILHYKRILYYSSKFPEMQLDEILIKKQIQSLILAGHDVQLHLHPHWIDAVYDGDKWQFNYNHFSLQSLNESDDLDDPFSLQGCVHRAKELMIQVISVVKPNYRVTTFRAGGYLIEPFDKLSKVFKAESIIIDSSTCPGMYNKNKISPYDFRNYPTAQKYFFEGTPKYYNKAGSYIEYPIRTICIPYLVNLYFILLRRYKYPKIEQMREGRGIGYLNTTSHKLLSKFKRLSPFNKSDRVYMLTTDSMFPEKFEYLLDKAVDNDVMILHPKLLNDYMINVLNRRMTSNSFCTRAII